MGWKVDVKFKHSGIHGTGVFAAEDIPAGTRVWEFDTSMKLCDAEAMPRLSPETITFALWGGYLHKPSGMFLWYDDGMNFLNHGSGAAANVGLDYWPKLTQDHVVALRDIRAGEELREDYGFCLDGGLAPDHWLRPLYLEHCPVHYAFLLRLVLGEDAPALREAQAAATNWRTTEISSPSTSGLARTARKPAAKQAA